MINTSKTDTSWDKLKFKEWLDNEHYKKKIVNDCISRCLRIEKVLGVDLIEATKNQDKYDELMEEIKVYSFDLHKNSKTKYSTNGCLRQAVRKFVQFYWNFQYK